MEASTRTRHARKLFAPLGPTYDRYARLLSFGQDPRWRSFLVSRIPTDAHRVLDVATGTAAVAIELARAEPDRTVVGVDQSPEMLAAGREQVAREQLSDRIELREARAEELPFAAGEFDAVTFTYLLRYVDDPAATMKELARVVTPGGVVASLEFHVPEARWARVAWRPYTRHVMPLVGSIVSPAWASTGRFLSRSIEEHWRVHPLQEQLGWWDAAGIGNVHTRTMSNGAAIVTWGLKR